MRIILITLSLICAIAVDAGLPLKKLGKRGIIDSGHGDRYASGYSSELSFGHHGNGVHGGGYHYHAPAQHHGGANLGYLLNGGYPHAGVLSLNPGSGSSVTKVVNRIVKVPVPVPHPVPHPVPVVVHKPYPIPVNRPVPVPVPVPVPQPVKVVQHHYTTIPQQYAPHHGHQGYSTGYESSSLEAGNVYHASNGHSGSDFAGIPSVSYGVPDQHQHLQHHHQHHHHHHLDGGSILPSVPSHNTIGHGSTSLSSSYGVPSIGTSHDSHQSFHGSFSPSTSISLPSTSYGVPSTEIHTPPAIHPDTSYGLPSTSLYVDQSHHSGSGYSYPAPSKKFH